MSKKMFKISEVMVIGSGPIIIGQAAEPIHLSRRVKGVECQKSIKWVGWSICSSIQVRADALT